MAKGNKKEREVLYLQDTHSLFEEKQCHDEKREYEYEDGQQDPTRKAKVSQA